MRWREADLLIVDRLARGVPGRLFRHRLQKAQAVININGDLADALHYNKTRRADRRHLGGGASAWRRSWRNRGAAQNKSGWLKACADKKAEWAAYKRQRYRVPAVP